MSENFEQIIRESQNAFDQWLLSCTRYGKISRNTIAIGLVILDHFRRRCPIAPDEVLSRGGEVKGARSNLKNILIKYNLPASYLKEVTTRQGHQDGQKLLHALNWGQNLASLAPTDREFLLIGLANRLTQMAENWLERQNLKLDIDRRHSPTTWIKLILDNARPRSGGVVEQHLVGAKLARRFPNTRIANYPAHAGDQQTTREGDFSFKGVIYHVTATPGRDVILKCSANLRVGMLPILLVPSDQEYKARALAQDEGIDEEIAIVSIESFVAMNIIELAAAEEKDLFSLLYEIVAIYNMRLVEVETDLSLQIEVR